MNILEVLKKDHEQVKALLEEMCETSETAGKKREQLFEKLKVSLMAHSHAEEKVFYKPLEKHEEAKDEGLEGEVEHEVAENLLKKLDKMDTTDERWLPTLKVLKEMVEHHIEEEEDEIFSKAEEVLDKETLEKMGDEMEREEAKEKKKIH